jgi:hypothetical protein
MACNSRFSYEKGSYEAEGETAIRAALWHAAIDRTFRLLRLAALIAVTYLAHTTAGPGDGEPIVQLLPVLAIGLSNPDKQLGQRSSGATSRLPRDQAVAVGLMDGIWLEPKGEGTTP